MKLENAKYLSKSEGFVVGNAYERDASRRTIVYADKHGRVRERELTQHQVSLKLKTCSLVTPAPGLTLRETYEQYVLLREALWKASKQRVDFCKCVGSTRGTPLHLFVELDDERCTTASRNWKKKLKQHIQRACDIASIDKDEGRYISKASTGALIWSDVSRTEPLDVYKYDVTSYYPSILCDKHFQFPTGPGEFAVITDHDLSTFEHMPFGIYRCVIQVPELVDKKLFRKNEANYYTHWDLKRARELCLQIEMCPVDEEEPFNVLLYQTNRACGATYFAETIGILFGLKQDRVPFAKDLLNNFWGALCQRRRRTVMDTEAACVGLRIDPVTDIATCYDLDNPYYYGLARLKPFLLAVARYRMSQLIEKVHTTCVRVHTDGVMVTRALTDQDIAGTRIKLTENRERPELGSLRYEGSLKIKIKNRTQYEILSSSS